MVAAMRALLLAGLLLGTGCATSSDAQCQRLKDKYEAMRASRKSTPLQISAGDPEYLRLRVAALQRAADEALVAADLGEYHRNMREAIRVAMLLEMLPAAEEAAFEMTRAALCGR